MNKENLLLAHIRDIDKRRQTLVDHLNAVSQLAGEFADKIGLRKTGEIIGLLHDFGKASENFQNYLLSGEGVLNPDADGYINPESMRGKIDHSTAGAQIIYENLWNKNGMGRIAAQVLALCVASHHSGLMDCLAPDGENIFLRRMEKLDSATHKSEAASKLQEIEANAIHILSQKESENICLKIRSLQEEKRDSQETIAFKAGLLVRFLLSCLVDADRLDTADFEMPSNKQIRNYGYYHPWKTSIQRLDQKISEFKNKKEKNEVDELRAEVSEACVKFAKKSRGIYQLTVPTGGGKTLSSLRFALNHAEHHKMDRVIYIIPYTSIIDQNANEIRKILEDKTDENNHFLDRIVLEHHSNLTPEEESHRQNLLAQNWDAPVVLTTQVQFFEALFGSGTRSVRRMHQLANSVIILDEVQTIPVNTIQMLNIALRFLVKACGSTVVLCTATQPPLDKIDAQYRALTIESEQRIIQNEHQLFEKLNRVEVFDERKPGGWSESELADLAEHQLQEKGSVLIVVNTKKSARLIYQTMKEKKLEDVKLYHLSTNMCPAHRLNILNEVKEKLNHEPVICVSTQLIEAGVDIDFGVVIRYLAGLDSIAQSAGRCNRHGARIGYGNVWIINPQNENIDQLKDIVIGTDTAKRVLDDFKSNPVMFGNNRLGLEAMAAYYTYYYRARMDDMRYKVNASSPVGREDDLFNLLSTNTLSVQAYGRTHHNSPNIFFRQSFQSAAKAFKVINSPTRGVIVQYKKKGNEDSGEDGEEIVKDLCGAPEIQKQYKLVKRAQRYSVNLFPHEFDRLEKLGAIHEVQKGAGIFFLDKQFYTEELGWIEFGNNLEYLSV